nr:hypothetical protein [Tanacetum cinerariifolium]
MGDIDINTLAMEQYLALTRWNQAPGVVKPEIENNVNFKIKSQFMRELREDTFSGNKNYDAHEHVERFLYVGVDFVKKEHILTWNARSTRKLRELKRSSIMSLEDLFQTMVKIKLGDMSSNEENKGYWRCMNDDERVDVAWEGMSFKD